MSSSSRQSSENNTPLIRLSRVTKCYGHQKVLQVDELDINLGDALLIYGQNGGGKSTLLRILAGVIPVSSGSVTRSMAMQKTKLVYIPQNGGLYRNLTVRDNLVIWGRLYNVDNLSGLSEQWYIRQLDLHRFMQHKVHQLSGGFNRIAAIACGLSVRPQAMLLDEPFSGMDDQKAEVLLKGLEDLHEQLDVLVLTSHKPGVFSRIMATHRHIEQGKNEIE